MVSWQGHVVMSRTNVKPIRGITNTPAANGKQGPVMKGWAQWSQHTLHTITLCLLISGPHDSDSVQCMQWSGIFIGTELLDGSAEWGLSSARPLARHKNEDELTEAITRSDGSDQLWATYGIQIVNCVRYPSGSRKYSILVWWCNYECWLLKSSTAKHIPNKPPIQYKIRL